MGVAYSVGEVDHLYTFFVQWSPDIYNKSKKKRCKSCNNVRKKRHNAYRTVDKDISGISKTFRKSASKPKAGKKWEIITVKDSKRRLSLSNSVESEVEENEYLDVVDDFPVLSHESQLLDEYHLQKLAAHLPPRTQGYPWHLVYSTNNHGSSLKTLYRNMADLDSPVLLVIKDIHKKVFGAFCSDPFRVSKYCYGTGETFLFSFNPDFQQYRWSGENSYFVSGNWESLQIGGGGGGFALWLDADLYHGASFSCPTFHNAPLSTHEDFIVQDVEVWTVQN
ncbi:nuclear receptor coactivator 7-like [Cyprinodon tularosa]|uniref:nuclear receptor coactivator 7-like n=1 Tax=Cyprinodon tularosa TaxID=77115 RepID=UPI000742C36A|nr:PREDICTED: nuclear receptor coactivator 7-like isoform X1 [Cyprinodon variegatus]XP_038131848.1 nuclear receptor coactivator 7-like [Cyprinodon tularosa]